MLPFLGILCGCGRPVTVVTRLDPDPSIWGRLDGTDYVLCAKDPQVEATLTHRSCACLIEKALAAVQPDLKRQADADSAALVLTLSYDVADRGHAVGSYPVHGRRYGYLNAGMGGIYRTYDCIGAETYTYHLGYRHSLTLSAWIRQEEAPADRRVIWEGEADLVSQDRFPDGAMTYLVGALIPFYSQSTGGPVEVSLQGDDPLLTKLQSSPCHARPQGRKGAPTPERGRARSEHLPQ
jgi:hypothetical protein